MSFKIKPTKTLQVPVKYNTTLDIKHKSILEKIKYEEDIVLPKLHTEKYKLKTELKHTDNIELQTELQDKIHSISSKIKKLRHYKSKYYLDNSKYIFDYYENKKIDSEGNCNVSSKTLNTFFNIKDSPSIVQNDILPNAQKYLANVDDAFLDINKFINQTDICNHCNKGELIFIEHEGLCVCNVCFVSIQYLIDNERCSYKEPHKEICFYAYKRINHFREILAQFQAKETTQIPSKVIEDIEQQMKKERIILIQLTNHRAKTILKKLGYNKYYEHIPYIKDKLGIKPPIMKPELEQRLCSLFMEIQTPYARFCPDVRVNFLNYYYTIYKLCELLDETEFLPFFPMLKDRYKRIEQDEIWKKICNELDWEFIPTI